ncbi:hypothetical protein [Methylobacterium brachiatum]|uniref:hypothetical protein n=1 Tax=Methylobacterium brachiatum TaxID=269660 RepID=UPI0013CF179F|nr:hypothetical protein [Methylobacterium brachiatum]
MHPMIADAQIAQVRQRASEGDCPTTPALSVESLEDLVRHLADRLPPTPNDETEFDTLVDATEFYEECLGRRLALNRAEAAEAALQRLVASLEGTDTILTDDQEAAYEAAASLLDELPTNADHQPPKPQST